MFDARFLFSRMSPPIRLAALVVTLAGLLIAAIPVSPLSAQEKSQVQLARTWTDIEQNKVKGKFNGFKDGLVSILDSDDRLRRIHPALLSKADQSFVSEQIKGDANILKAFQEACRENVKPEDFAPAPSGAGNRDGVPSSSQSLGFVTGANDKRGERPNMSPKELGSSLESVPMQTAADGSERTKGHERLSSESVLGDLSASPQEERDIRGEMLNLSGPSGNSASGNLIRNRSPDPFTTSSKTAPASMKLADGSSPTLPANVEADNGIDKAYQPPTLDNQDAKQSVTTDSSDSPQSDTVNQMKSDESGSGPTLLLVAGGVIVLLVLLLIALMSLILSKSRSPATRRNFF